jgi:hypothetical protein
MPGRCREIKICYENENENEVTNKWYLPFKIRRRLIGCECTVEEEAAFP